MQRIVIIGAGFGGLRAAQKIGRFIKFNRLRERYEVVVIDRNDHHTYTPLLYEVATTSKAVANITRLHEIVAYPIDSLFGDLPVHILRGNVTAITMVPRNIILGNDRQIAYDLIVIAPGTEVSYFDIPGVEANAVALKTFQGAIKIRDMIWDMALMGHERIKIVVGGAGSTGVEFAGELGGLCRELDQVFPTCQISVEIIEAAQNILPGFSPHVVSTVKSRLAKLGVAIMTGKKIVNADNNSITTLGGERILYNLFVWAGGVQAPDFFATLQLKKEHQGQIAVDTTMHAQDMSGGIVKTIFVIGDAAYVQNPKTQKPAPQVARAAILEADVAAHNLCEEIMYRESSKHSPHLRHFVPYEYPYVIPVGGKYAIAKIGWLTFSGILGWLFKGLIELNYLLSIMPMRRAISIWCKGLKIFLQNDRLG